MRLGRAIFQVVKTWILTAQSRVESRTILCKIRDRRSGIEGLFSLSSPVSPANHHSSIASYLSNATL
jgi:hypothetical protein